MTTGSIPTLVPDFFAAMQGGAASERSGTQSCGLRVTEGTTMTNDIIQRIADGRTDLVFELAASAHDDPQNPGSASPLQWCAYYGDVAAIRYCLTQGAALERLGDNVGLNAAAFHGHWQLCQFLLEHGANVNQPQSHTRETPLHAALCKANRPAYDLVVQVLIAHGADPNAATAPNVETGSFMRDCRTKAETALHRAAAFGSELTVQRLLDAGAAVDARDMNGETPLAWASWHLRPDTVLRSLCYGPHAIHPARRSTYDHGSGWEVMGIGTPHVSR